MAQTDSSFIASGGTLPYDSDLGLVKVNVMYRFDPDTEEFVLMDKTLPQPMSGHYTVVTSRKQLFDEN